jgi:branched-chain amino acid transport system substrate-binding protein
MRIGRHGRWIAALAACGLVVGACGSSAPKDATGRQSAEPPAATADPGAAAAPSGGSPADASAAPAGTDAPATGEAGAAAGSPAASGSPAAATPAPGGSAPKSASAAPSGSGGQSTAKPGSKTVAGGGSSGSGGASSGSASPGSGVAPTPGVPGPAPAPAAGGPCAPMSIGTWGTTTGPLGALFGAMTPAAKAWVASVNARGGLAGCHQVKLIVGDDGDDPAKAKAIVKKMVEEDGVSAFVAHHGALTLGAVRPYLEQKRVPLFGSSGAYADESESEMVFLAQPTSVVGESEAYINNVLALNLPQRKIAVFWCAEVPLCSVHNDVIKKQAAAKGFQVVASIRISLFAPDYTSEVLQARQSGADMIVLLTDMQTNGRLLRSANRQNYKPLVVTPGVNYDTQWPDIIGRDADGMITTAWSRPWHIEGINREYREAMGRYQPGQVMGNSGSAAWAGMKLLEKAGNNLDRDKPTAEQIIQGVYKLSNETLGGLIPPTTWPKDLKQRAALHPCTVPVRWTGSAFELPLGEKFVCSAPGNGVRIVD